MSNIKAIAWQPAKAILDAADKGAVLIYKLGVGGKIFYDQNKCIMWRVQEGENASRYLET